MDHRYQDAVSLTLGRRIAADLPNRPEWMALARENLQRWTVQNADAPGLVRCYTEWLALLDRGVSEVCRILTQESDEGQRLRQSSPFAGALSPQEVWDIKRRVRNEQTAA